MHPAFTSLDDTNEDDDFFASLTATTQAKQSAEMFTTKEDVLVLSCVLYRLKTTATTEEDKNYWNAFGLLSVPTDKITQDDRILADHVRSYFNSKLVLARIRGESLSKYRTDLSKFLNTAYSIADGYMYPINFTGLIYKLPYFHEYDQGLYEVFGGDYYNLRGPGNRLSGNKTLTFIKRLDPHRRLLAVEDFWFSDEHGNRILLTIDKKNPLTPLFETVLNHKVKIEANYDPRHKDTLNFYQANSWKFVSVD